MKDFTISDWTIDESTGFLRHKVSLTAVSPENKAMFLVAFMKMGDQSRAAKASGLTMRQVQFHLKVDKAFYQAFKDALLEMKHTLEGVSFVHGRKQEGFRDRVAWLTKNFPEEYGNKGKGGKEEAKKKIDALWDEISPNTK